MTDEKTRALLAWLGKIVTVTLDPGEGKRGILSGTVNGADTVFRVYLLRAFPLGTAYTGKVTAIFKTTSEEEDRLIVTPVGVEMYEPWIRHALGEVRDVSSARIFCLYEKSCGVIPYRERNGQLEYLALFQSGSSTWSFPKGHMEYGEDEVATARREVEEEIGVKLDIVTDFRCEIFYSVHNRRSRKRVVLFAVPFDGEVKLRAGEIGASRWLGRQEIQKLFGHKELRGIFNSLEKKCADEKKTGSPV